MALEDERRTVAEAMRTALGQENALTAAQARLFVRCLQYSWQVPPNRWSERESQEQLADARRLLHAADIFREVDGLESLGAIECYRRAAELLEWLSRADDSIKTMVPLALYAAGAYQLGELPAMATSLLRQAVVSDQVEALDIDDGGFEEENPTGDDPRPRIDTTSGMIADIPVDRPEAGYGKLYAAFLQGDFDSVLRLCADFWSRHHELTGRSGSAAILGEDSDDRISWFLVVELVRALGLIADAMRRGDEVRLAAARRKLAGLESLAVRSTAEDVWLLLTLLRSTAERFAAASIYSRVDRLAANAPRFASRLRLFAREQFARGRGVLWTSQMHGLDRLAETSSFALCTPTGSGKTLVANLAIVKELLLTEPGDIAPLALYLVPSRALAGEVEAKLTAELGRDVIVTGLYGGADWGITDYWITADQPTVLIATVEKADALMRYLGPLLLARLKLLIIDEAHQVVAEVDARSVATLVDHGSRAMRLESLVSRLLSLKPAVVRIALTAVAGGAAAPVARWMEGRADATAVGVNYRSSRQLIGTLEASPGFPGRLQLDLMNGRPLYVRGREDPVYLPLRIAAMPRPPASVRRSVDHYNQVHILWTALHLRDGGRRILISVPQEPEQTMRWFVETLARTGWADLAVFTEPEGEGDGARYREALAACQDYCGENSYELALLRFGIATSHGQMPQRLRRLMTDLIDRRVCAITVATATLTEGVNLPFDLIFLTALKRRSFDQDAAVPIIAPISTSEFRNLAGRAGRPGASEGVEGMTLIGLVLSPPSTAAGEIPTQRTQVGAMATEYDDLLNRLAEDTAPHAVVASPLAILLQLIATHVRNIYNFQTSDQFYGWLETSLPETISTAAGTSARTAPAQLADSLDELDGVLLAAIEELSRFMSVVPDGPATEAFLRTLWARTFTQVAVVQEAWLEETFVRRGRAVVERLYPNAPQRRRLYQYGFAPVIGRRFELVAPVIRAELAGAEAYGASTAAERIALFERLGIIIRDQPGFGFRVRGTVGDQAILANWTGVLRWWMQVAGAAPPDPRILRAWQRFVSDNLEFRLGVGIGAVVAEAWSEGAGDALTPELGTWRATARLPWFGFWARELLRWGTLDPFIAFCLAQGLAQTRKIASTLRPEFNTFLLTALPNPIADDFIDPQQFLAWQRQQAETARPAVEARETVAVLTGTDGARGRYGVIPVQLSRQTIWLDAAGYALATSTNVADLHPSEHHHDYELRTDGRPRIQRVFNWTGAD
jgi:hypothetical protein